MSPIILRPSRALWVPGDIAVCGIVVVGTATVPGVPSGATAVNAGITTTAGGGGSMASRMFWRQLAAGDTNFGSFTSGNTTDDWAAAIGIYRGVNATVVGKLGTSLAGAGPTITFPAVASPLNDSNSWVLTFGCNNGTNIATSSTPPTGTVLRELINAASGVAGIGLFDTDAIVSSFAQATTTSGTGGARTGMSFELRGAASGSLHYISGATSSGTSTPGNPSLPAQSPGVGFHNERQMREYLEEWDRMQQFLQQAA